MNLFILDQNPRTAARYYCDKHVVKIILESFQMMGSAVRRHGAIDEQMPLTKAGKPLKGGYSNHPVTRWVGETRGNYDWTFQHVMELSREYTRRYDKIHACHHKIAGDLYQGLAHLIPPGSVTDFALAMPEDYKSDNAILSYREYYKFKEGQIKMTWTNSKKPEWML